MSPSTPTNGAAAMGGYAQNSLSSAGATGGMAPMQPSNGIGGPSNQGGGGAGNAGAMETINQAYAGIQQYAGLSGLLNQGKWHFFLFSDVPKWRLTSTAVYAVCVLSLISVYYLLIAVVPIVVRV